MKYAQCWFRNKKTPDFRSGQSSLLWRLVLRPATAQLCCNDLPV